MKCTIPEISWHNRDPVLSVDIQSKILPNENFWRLATGGNDSHVLIWHITVNSIGSASTFCVSDLQRHQKAVNVVRFSPSGELLASGDDESIIIIWRKKDEQGSMSPSLPLMPCEDNLNKEQWMSLKILRGHLEDVYDISWSPDSNMLVSGSVDNSVIIWDVQKGKSINILRDHKGFVQGVSWDPCNKYITTLSTDRYCRLIDISSFKTIQRIQKAKIPVPCEHHLKGKIVRLFYDDTLKTYCRRLTFSPDGYFIIAPSGIIESKDSTEQISNATVIFARNNLKDPIMILPSFNEPTIAVKCCPIYFKLRENGSIPTISLPYRLIFAVATQKSIFIYDTQQISAIAVISNIHYTRLTDIAWSFDGKILVVSSTDGYCSIIYFQPGELGEIFSDIRQNDFILNKKESVNNLKDLIESELLFNSNFNSKIEKNVKNNEKLVLDNNLKINDLSEDISLNSQDFKLEYNEKSEMNTADVTDTNFSEDKVTLTSILQSKQPRRVQLITLSSPKRTKK